jgi:solute carrier family 45, member 1/2/4
MGYWFGDQINEANPNLRTFNQTTNEREQNLSPLSSRKFGTTLTVLGVLLLDLDCDACQSPSRAYLLDVTDPSQHSLGLTTFTIMAGLGGCLGYLLGGIPWEQTFLSTVLGDQIHVLFTLVWIIYIVCMLSTLTASHEPKHLAIPAASLLRSASRQFLIKSDTADQDNDQYRSHTCQSEPINENKVPYFEYIRSIIYMPSSLRWLCLTNFFCWMALVSYSLFFTDFVGQSVFGKKNLLPSTYHSCHSIHAVIRNLIIIIH